MVRDLQKSLQTKERTHLVMLVLLERDNFCVNFVISLTSYAVVCSNVVVHNSDHNALFTILVYSALSRKRRYVARTLFYSPTRSVERQEAYGFQLACQSPSPFDLVVVVVVLFQSGLASWTSWGKLLQYCCSAFTKFHTFKC